MNLFKKYNSLPIQAKASLWFLICGFFQKAISSITTPIFTRLLTTAEYGQYSVFNSWLSIFTIIVSLNLWGGVYMQGLVKYEDNRKKFSSSLQGLTLTLILIWSAIYILFHNFWNKLFSLSTPQMISLFVLIWTTSSFNFWASEQRVDFKYKNLVLITFFVSFLKPLIGIILVLNCNDKVTGRIIGLVLVELLFYSGCFASQMVKGKQFFSKQYWKYGLSFNIPLLPHYLSMSILSGADRIMISSMRGDSEAGIYSLAYSISLIMTMFNNALFQTFEPWLYKKIKTKNIEEISPIAYLAFGMIAFFNILLIIFAPEIVKIFAPKEYYEAIWIIPPVTMSVFFNFAYTFFATFEFYYEKKSYISLATLIGAVLNVLLNYIFIGIFGYYAAGYTTLFCYILYAVFHYIFMRKICKEYLDNRQPYSMKVLLQITLLFIGIGFGIMMTYNNSTIRYGLIAVMVMLLFRRRRNIAEIINKIIGLKRGNI